MLANPANSIPPNAVTTALLKIDAIAVLMRTPSAVTKPVDVMLPEALSINPPDAETDAKESIDPESILILDFFRILKVL
jgi:hypothetical protein